MDLTTLNSAKIFAKSYTDKKIADLARGFKFRGFVSTTEPTNAVKGELWYNSATMPTEFPIQVKTYSGTAWSESTSEYTPADLDMWANSNDDNGYYWFGNAWNKIDFNAPVDNTTIDYNQSNQLEVKDGGVTFAKMGADAVSNSIPASDPSSSKLATENAVHGAVAARVAINQGALHAGQILVVNAEGNLDLVEGVTFTDGHFQYES